MLLFDDQVIGDLLEHDLETANIDTNGVWSPSTSLVPFYKGSSEGKYIKWQTFTNLEVLIQLLNSKSNYLLYFVSTAKCY